jgi:hypothetical protein
MNTQLMGIRVSGECELTRARNSSLFEIALVLMRFDHVASGIISADHGMM